MNIKQLKGFYELSKTLNFSKTANRLYMSQPAFSRMIESLENELGTKLIIRDKVHPKLTEEAIAILPRVERILSEIDGIQGDIDALRETGGSFTVGVLEGGLYGANAESIRAFTEENPGIDVEFVELSESEVFEAIERRVVDGAFVVHYPEMYRAKLQGAIVAEYRLGAVMNERNALAERDSLSVRDLKDEPFVVIGEDRSRFGYSSTMSLCLRYGFSPRIARKVSSLTMALSEIDMGRGVMILHEQVRGAGGPHTVFVPLEGEEAQATWCVARKDNDNPALKKFLEFIEVHRDEHK